MPLQRRDNDPAVTLLYGVPLELQLPFRFFGALLVGSALLPMAQTRKELALLGGTFLFGLSALEICLRVGGF